MWALLFKLFKEEIAFTAFHFGRQLEVLADNDLGRNKDLKIEVEENLMKY